ncbi:MAG: hypothetical protein KDD67_14945 [Ignavibacteriae bacterium]|nr:hypothetical protein [Ignavibacteriota bacterium]MCB9217606.1 hypothetical protein [Ignavibacteria bacterium]
MHITKQLLVLSLLLLSFHSISLYSQPFVVYPTHIYPGENVLTIKSSSKGIRRITTNISPVQFAPFIEVGGDGSVGGCPNEHDLRVSLHKADRNIALTINVEFCDGSTQARNIGINKTWTLDEVPLEDVYVGDTACTEFRIGATAPEYLDSVTIDAPNAYTRFSFPPPIQLGGVEYRYEVCFVADRPGLYRFPVITWMRRDEVSGGYSNYPVADTGVIRVKPRPGNVILEEIPIDTSQWLPPKEVTDPTTFRSVAVPNAIIPPKGRAFVGSYDVLGLTAGYALTDNLLLFAGGAVPTPDDWGGVNGDMFGAWSLGGKGGTELFEKFNVAGGYHFGQSTLDKEFTPDEVDSRITLHVPYAAVSYGTDDSRVSLTGGYAFKRHSTWITTDPVLPPLRDEYNDDAAFAVLGGDYRLGRHWKVAGEALWMGSVDVLPIVATGRYFTEKFALDFGVTYAGIALNGAEVPPIPLVPIISAIFVF